MMRRKIRGVVPHTRNIVGRRMLRKKKPKIKKEIILSLGLLTPTCSLSALSFHGLWLDVAPTSYFSFLLPKPWTDKGFAIRFMVVHRLFGALKTMLVGRRAVMDGEPGLT